MHDLDTEKNFPDEKSKNPNGSTGPTSLDGKAKSSLNRLTHGCRAETIVLPFEDHAEWDFTLQSWQTSYNPQEETAATLVFETARAHWVFQRNQKRLAQTESGLPPDPIHWTPDHHQQYSNFLRYKTTAERSFYRAFNNLDAYYQRQAAAAERAHRAIDARCAREERARAQMGKIQMRWLKEKAAAAAERDLCGFQYIEVTRTAAGDCVTSIAPANDQLAASLAERTQLAKEQNKLGPKFVTRYIHFFNGVPPAYDWLHANDIQQCRSCMGVQHFTYEDWLLQIEAEKVAGTGHLQPFTTGILLEA